jgi:hypothetical protein
MGGEILVIRPLASSRRQAQGKTTYLFVAAAVARAGTISGSFFVSGATAGGESRTRSSKLLLRAAAGGEEGLLLLFFMPSSSESKGKYGSTQVHRTSSVKDMTFLTLILKGITRP